MNRLGKEELISRIVQRMRSKYNYKIGICDELIKHVLDCLREVVIQHIKYKNVDRFIDIDKHIVEIPGIVEISGYDSMPQLYFDACPHFLNRIKRADKQNSARYKKLLLECEPKRNEKND